MRRVCPRPAPGPRGSIFYAGPAWRTFGGAPRPACARARRGARPEFPRRGARRRACRRRPSGAPSAWCNAGRARRWPAPATARRRRRCRACRRS
ncbi:hypothetical protein C7C56_019055 [Massilia glaciei]|uniref:Uncharacterized protein n=1 Tax=Massilia glaciei TaxID=1524097 RepID=A0A2U2HGY5_9BURK|nr:hypothetical protein C7C56_019055 [Massilia glaciei]